MALTPMMQQYLEIKENCKDCILFFRLGDFYEMFFEDAEKVSRELEITLTGRDCGLEQRAPMCGVPYHAAEGYIARLIEKGYKVAICEQVEDPSVSKGIVRREIVRIVTPGTLIDSNLLDEKSNNFIGCLLVDHSHFSLSVCDISTGEFSVTSEESSFTKSMDELSKYNPSELIIIENDYIKENEKVVKDISNRFNILINIKNYEKINNLDLIKKFNLQGIELKEKELLTTACLFEYLIETQKGSIGQITEIKKYDLNNYMVLDSFTRKNLELTETIRSKSKKGSLLWVLDKTLTAMGGRMLRKWIEEPLLSIESINNRLETVEEFVDNLYVSSDLREYLKNIYDMERLISKVSCGAANARDLISLKESLRYLPDFKAALSSCKSSLLKEIYSNLDTLNDIFILIDSSINDNPPLQLKEGGIIKQGYNKDVDMYHEAMHNGKRWIAEIEQKEKELLGIKSLKIGFNKVFGYFIEVTKSNLSAVPDDRYIRKQTLSNCERFITQELKEKEEQILGAEQKVIDLEYELFVEIRNQVASNIARIQKTAAYISTIDVLLSFSRVAYENNYVRPEITKDGLIDIKDGRHPVVEKVITNIFVPNDTYLNLTTDNIAIITGPNMAGKSTYMRQVALITLLAQIGCFVPAKSAKVSIVDRIFTRIGASDDLSLGQSTFMVEMSEVSNILKNATKNSLIILDEVGRGTSTFDGLSIAWAVVDYITKNIGAKTLFATHYHELTELEERVVGIKNYCISVKEHGEDIIFLRKIVRGGADKSYGIQVAKIAGLPEEVISSARKILKNLEESDINNKVKRKEKEEVAITASLKSDETMLQLDMFNYKDYRGNDIIKELQNIDMLNITPIEAINLLYNLVQRAKKV